MKRLLLALMLGAATVMTVKTVILYFLFLTP
jgi:hypothetical protein